MSYKISASTFNAHKSSGDHDGRYYTEAEINTKVSSLQTQIDAINANVTATTFGGLRCISIRGVKVVSGTFVRTNVAITSGYGGWYYGVVSLTLPAAFNISQVLLIVSGAYVENEIMGVATKRSSGMTIEFYVYSSSSRTISPTISLFALAI